MLSIKSETCSTIAVIVIMVVVSVNIPAGRLMGIKLLVLVIIIKFTIIIRAVKISSLPTVYHGLM